MDRITLRLIQEKFHAYVRTFYSDDSLIQENIKLKEDHSLRVCTIAEKLAKSLGLDAENSNLCMGIGILHDIGRFPQFSRYRTFRDNLSVNHAELGLTVLTETDILAEINPAEEKIIRTAILNHNRIEIEGNLDEQTFMHSKIIRDADKLDILPLMIGYYETRKHTPKPGLELTFPDTSGFNEDIIDRIIKGERIPNNIRTNYNDLKLSQLSWLLDLNFPFSYRYADEHQFAEKLHSHLPDEKRINSAVAYVETVVRSRGTI
ncbi:MAG TPA: HD domain-containing protein [Spirochaetota bacterium]